MIQPILLFSLSLSYHFEFLDLFFCLQVTELLQESYVREESAGLQEVEQAE